ncbi:MAG: cytochrome C [Bacteroidota bacterium]
MLRIEWKFLILLLVSMAVYSSCVGEKEPEDEGEKTVQLEAQLIEEGVHIATGFKAEGDYKLVIANCTSCHSSQLVTQNRATKEGWEDMIAWMQKTQKLWDLGENHDKIVTYLATYYGPEKKGRRTPLLVEEWYAIE